MHHLSPPDELAEIRSDIARLKLLQAALHELTLATPDNTAIGRWHRIEVVASCNPNSDARQRPLALH